MPRPREMTPTLFKRGKNGNFCFRRLINGKDKEINTGTSIKAEAEGFRKRFIESEIASTVEIRQGRNAMKAAVSIISNITRKDLERIPLTDAIDIYKANNADYSSNTNEYNAQHDSMIQKFIEWSSQKGLHYLDEVDNSIARQYSVFLWTKNISASTHDRHVKVLSKLFQDIDAIKNLPNRNPFNSKNVKRKQIGMETEASHRGLTAEMVARILKCAAEAGQDWLDLFVIGLNTGMRLKDAALFEWNYIDGDIIDFNPHKTRRFRNKARVAISPAVREIVDRRKKSPDRNSPYVLPRIARYYLTGHARKCSQRIFEAALGGKEITQYPAGEHRKNNTCIYGFHSFRATFATGLAMMQTHYRDAMRMLGWTSIKMVRLYEKEMEDAKRESDKRSEIAINNMPIIRIPTIEVTRKVEHLLPQKEVLERFINIYSNITIGKIYDISSVAVGHWLKRYGLTRTDRIISDKVTEEEIRKVREELRKAA